MGVLVKRSTYGAGVKDVKQQLVAAIFRFNEILRSSAKQSINVEPEGKTRVVIVSKTGTHRMVEVEQMGDDLFKELMSASAFEVEFFLKRMGPNKPKVVVWYDEATHMGNALGVEFIVEYAESPSYKLLGFIGGLNLVKAHSIRPLTESVLARLQSLWESVFRMYLGAAMSKSEEKFNLRKYEPDAILINIFGNIIKMREG